MGKAKEKVMSEVLMSVVKKLKPLGDGKRQELLAAWSKTIGEEMACHTRIKGLRRGSLYVEVDSSALLQELTGMNQEELRVEMQEKLNKVRLADIKLRLAKD
ncbi:MAG: DUF721 domain-containing protein [Candidatus Brocadiales bacterium]|nr:DUF721 domain-containing protein [Candidatus Bathyanammoxibius amoris]